jgi:hypothetical protein
MRRPRAMTRRMVHVSVDSWKDGRVPGVDMMEVSFGESAMHTKKCVGLPGIFLKKR